MPDQPSRQRQRLKTGCEGCRARRVKCDEQKPVCGGCRRKGQECVFNNWIHVNLNTDNPAQTLFPSLTDFPLKKSQPPPPSSSNRRYSKSTAAGKPLISSDTNRVAKVTPSREAENSQHDLLKMFFDFESYQANPFLGSPTDVLVDITDSELYEHFLKETVPILVVSEGSYKNRLRSAFANLCPRLPLLYHLAVAYAATHIAQRHGFTDTKTLAKLIDGCYAEVDSFLDQFGVLSVSGTALGISPPSESPSSISSSLASSPLPNVTTLSTSEALLNEDVRLAFVLCALLASLEIDRGHDMTMWLKYATLAVKLITRRARKFPQTLESLTRSDGDDLETLENLAMRYVGQIIGVTNIVGSANISFGGNFDFKWWPRWDERFDPATGIDLNFVSLYADIADLIYINRHGLACTLTAVTDFHHRILRALNTLSRSINDASGDTDPDIIRLSLYHRAMQVHIYRRALGLGMRHSLVRHKLAQMHSELERFCAPDSCRNSTISFILATLACETDYHDTQKREALSKRLKAMDNGDASYNKRTREAIEKHWRDGAQLLITSSFPVSL